MADDSDYVAMTTHTETDDTDDSNYTDDSEFEMIDLESKPRSMSIDFIINDSDSSSESDSESVTYSRHINLSEDEICDIIIDIYELFDEYIESNVIELSSPTFYDQMFKFVTEILLEEWIDADLCDEDHYSDIQDFVKDIYTLYVDFSRIPPRSKPRSETAIVVNTYPLSSIREQIHKLQQIPQPAQRTPEWHAFRNGLISASNAWKVFGSEAMQNSIIYEKCKSNDETNSENTLGRWCNVNSPMHWGVKYEPVSVMLYEKLTSAKIGEFGCIQHPKYPFIGASPDGINIDETSAHYGRMLEIKNIVNREITGIPKLEYWIQTQLQMETCDLDECDFFETRFIEYPDETAFYEDDREDLHRGVILYFTKHGDVNATPIYRYLPLSVNLDHQTIAEWINNTKHEIQREYETDHITHNSTIYWYLDEYSCVLVERNRPWFAAALPKIREIWGIIERERKTGYEHRAAKKRESAIHKILVSIEESSTSYIVNNMPLSNSICIVKLDT